MTNEKTSKSTRRAPNVLITGVPGTGKTTLAEALSEALGASVARVDVNALARAREFFLEYDDEMDTHVLDEDALLDEMESELAKTIDGGCVVDYHSCELFPERWFDLVVCLTCASDTATLYERLEKRGYGERKIRENVECDIFQVVVEEAKDSYENVWVRENKTLEEMEATTREVAAWFNARVEERKKQG